MNTPSCVDSSHYTVSFNALTQSLAVLCCVLKVPLCKKQPMFICFITYASL